MGFIEAWPLFVVTICELGKVTRLVGAGMKCSFASRLLLAKRESKKKVKK